MDEGPTSSSWRLLVTQKQNLKYQFNVISFFALLDCVFVQKIIQRKKKLLDLLL